MTIEPHESSLILANLTYYDILAILCAKIDSLDDTSRRELYDVADANLDSFILRAAERFHWLTLKGRTPQPSYYDIEESDAYELLCFSETTNIDDLGVVLGSISLIDTAMDLSQNFKKFIAGKNCRVISNDDYFSDAFYAFDALNYNTKDTCGLILPCLFCEWEKHSDRSLDTVAFMPLSLVLKNYIWIPCKSGFKVNNFYTDMKNIGVGSALAPDMLPLKIISSPIIKHAPFFAELNKKDREFYIRYQDLYNQVILKRMKEVIAFSFRECADIVIFPEMMGIEYCINSCKDYIGELGSNKKPKLYILPSREYCNDGNWYNTVDILDEDGDCIFKYNKQHSFKFDHKVSNKKKISFKEPIVPDGNVCVFHVPGIGRIGVIICSDIFKDGYLQWLIKNLKLTLLLYPVYSSGKDLLIRSLSIAHTLSCDVLMCNTCAAWEDILIRPDERPNNEEFDSTFVNVYYPYGHLPATETVQTITCNKKECTGCLFVTSVSKNYRCHSGLIEQIRLEGD